jgi:RNA polymerase sigma-70 factor (ECF subfamily)
MRTCVVLAHGEGMTHEEIAAATGLPLGTVKSHIARGSARLRLALAPQEALHA